MKVVDLTGDWKFRLHKDSKGKIKHKNDLTRWMNARVPGTVHTDLMSLGIIPDPYYRMNERDVQWVDTCTWEYKKDFTLSADFENYKRIELIVEGLDTFATILVNDSIVAESDNMFAEQRIDIRSNIKKGKNSVCIIFHSPTECITALEKKYGELLVANEPARVYARKAQYSFGWDWGPKLTTSGIWRSIYIEMGNGTRLKEPFIKTVTIDNDHAVVECISGIEKNQNKVYKLKVIISGDDHIIESAVRLENDFASVRMEIPEPQLWWPNGWGEAYLYTAQFQLLDETENVVDSYETHFGIRTVKLIREKDEAGESFIFEINGRKIFSKGANWIPADNFITRIPDARYERLLHLAADAHMNTIRVWGGGIYEQKIFYDICDRFGLMVWQDFMFACGEYPEHENFVENVRSEATQVVKKLRNHPSIIIWCGNNENEYMYCNENPTKKPDDMKGARIFRDVIKEICDTFDDTRPYWRSSPFGTGHPNEETNGNHHQWDSWSNWKDFQDYSNISPRYVTEFGFQAPPNRKTFDEVTEKNDRNFQSPVLEHHNKQVEGTERLYKFQAGHYTLVNEYDEFIYRGQLLQAEALKYAIEHWRRKKFHTAGSIFWQLNDCWPVSSWSVIDSSLRPKAGYYYSKRFFAPVLVSIHQLRGKYNIFITNDTLQKVEGTLILDLFDTRAKKKQLFKKRISVDENTSRIAVEIKNSDIPINDPASEYLRVRYKVEREIISENRFFIVKPKHFIFPEGNPKIKISKVGENNYSIEVASRLFIKNLYLDMMKDDIILTDNYFDIDAGEKKTVYFSSTRSLKSLKNNIIVKWLTS